MDSEGGMMGTSWDQRPSPVTPARLVAIIVVLIVCAWLVVMMGVARGMYDESPGMVDRGQVIE